MIHVSDLHKSYGDFVAVNGVSFDIQQGETFGLLGPNGAGKTTTLSMLVGTLKPNSGTITVGGEDPTAATTRRQIGIAPQALSLYEELTADENLKFFAQLYEFSGAALQERIDWAIQFAALGDRRKSRVSTYSGGMKRRLNMAAAMIHEPHVILLDEPTVGVDPQSRNHIFDRIEELERDKRTIIYTTHYMEEAQRLCDRIAIMDSGKILAIGTVDELISEYGGDSFVTAEITENPESKALPGELDGNVLRFQSTDPLAEVFKLSEGGVKLGTLEVKRPDLETVFLSLTGRSLRDE